MTFIVADRVQETTNSPGTGTATLLGAVSGYQSFSTGIGANNTTYYVIADQLGTNWEVGLGALNSTGTVLTRTTVYSSSNGGSTVNFATGLQYVWCDYPSSKAVTQGNPVIFSSIGATTAGTGAFTTLSASSTVSGAGFSNYFAAPPTIGNTTPNAGAFTTLSASSTVSGTGFSTYLASPPAIGGTAAAAGNFTTLSADSLNLTNGIAATKVIYNEGGTGAVDTTVAAKLQETISVLDFGADPTGVASSVTAFQNAINATNTAKVEVIHVPRGTYLGDMTTLTYGTGVIIWQEEGGVTYTTAAPSGENCVRQNTTMSGDNTRAWSVGFNGMSYDYVTGTNRPVLRIQKTNNATTTAAGNASALSIQNSVNNTSGQLSNGAIENCLVMETDVYTNATTAATPAFGIIQGSLFKHNASYGSYIASNFVARDQTTLGSANSHGSLVAMELDVVASGPDTVSRLGLDIVGRGYDASVDGATQMYAGCRVRPANSGVVTNEPMELIYGYKTEVNSLGSIDTHFFADGPCKSTGYHFLAVSDSTVQGKAKIASQRNTAGQVTGQLEFGGWNSSNVLQSYATLSTVISDPIAGTEDGTLQVYTQNAGTNTLEVSIHKGMTVGIPTGGSPGVGKINVSGGIYLNGSAYTNPDYVFEKAYTGKIEKFANNVGADTYVSRTIEEAEQYTKDNLALPGFGQDANLDYLGGSEMLLARLEEAYLYIFELNKEIKELKAKVESL